MTEAYRKLVRQEDQNKCGGLVAFKKDQSGLKRCIKLATTTISVNANVVAVLNAKILLLNIIRLLGDLSHNLTFQQT